MSYRIVSAGDLQNQSIHPCHESSLHSRRETQQSSTEPKMHGRKKRVISEAELEGLRVKAEGYCKLSTAISNMKQEQRRDVATLDLIQKMLTMNPDFYSLWNFRREILEHEYSKKPFDRDAGERELTLSSLAIQKNPKSYPAWQHRLWVGSKVVGGIDYNEEIRLCDKFLSVDQRNFHCWNYRREVVKLGNISSEDEMEFSMKKIGENFSNYSAFHHRSVYLKDCDGDINDRLEKELSIVHDAIFTEPDDQSAWWYYQFLMNWGNEKQKLGDDADLKSRFRDILNQQIETVKSLLDLESESKWAMVTLAYLLQLLMKMGSDSDENEGLTEERCSLLRRLCELDKAHKNRYLYLLSS